MCTLRRRLLLLFSFFLHGVVGAALEAVSRRIHGKVFREGFYNLYFALPMHGSILLLHQDLVLCVCLSTGVPVDCPSESPNGWARFVQYAPPLSSFNLSDGLMCEDLVYEITIMA